MFNSSTYEQLEFKQFKLFITLDRSIKSSFKLKLYYISVQLQILYIVETFFSYMFKFNSVFYQHNIYCYRFTKFFQLHVIALQLSYFNSTYFYFFFFKDKVRLLFYLHNLSARIFCSQFKCFKTICDVFHQRPSFYCNSENIKLQILAVT